MSSRRYDLGVYPLLLIGLIFVIVLAAIFAPWVRPHDPVAIELAARLLPPAWIDGGSWEYPLGTDNLGRDILSRMIEGGRVSLAVGFLAVFFAGSIGISVGLFAGYFGGWIDAALMRITDAACAVPIILVALLFVITLGPSFSNMVIALTALLWARYPRVIRSDVLSLRTREFVLLARAGGASHLRIIFVHILPNVFHNVVVLLTLQLGVAIITEATLSFLGAGVPVSVPAWGNMISLGRDYVATAWWIAFFPGVAIFVTVLVFNLLGDWLREFFDPTVH